ncbi:MAG: zf-HC2 domain-containing protein [Candidatus Krumholzibacteriia bacterium]
MMNCKEVTRLVAESADHDLRFHERMRVRVHLAICFLCRRFTRQLALISKASGVAGGTDALLADGGVLNEAALSPDVKARIKNRLAHDDPGE